MNLMIFLLGLGSNLLLRIVAAVAKEGGTRLISTFASVRMPLLKSTDALKLGLQLGRHFLHLPWPTFISLNRRGRATCYALILAIVYSYGL